MLKHSPQPLPQPPPPESTQLPPPDSTQPLPPDSMNMTMGLRRFVRKGRALIWGSLGFVWLLVMRRCNWTSVTLCGPIPELFRTPIELEWGKHLTLHSVNLLSSI